MYVRQKRTGKLRESTGFAHLLVYQWGPTCTNRDIPCPGHVSLVIIFPSLLSYSIQIFPLLCIGKKKVAWQRNRTRMGQFSFVQGIVEKINGITKVIILILGIMLLIHANPQVLLYVAVLWLISFHLNPPYSFCPTQLAGLLFGKQLMLVVYNHYSYCLAVFRTLCFPHSTLFWEHHLLKYLPCRTLWGCRGAVFCSPSQYSSVSHASKVGSLWDWEAWGYILLNFN